jgi:flagellar basal-body rod protein FlgC
MSFWDSLRIGASALNAQRLRLDLISNNIANAETTRTEAGGPYQRQDVVFTTREPRAFLPALLKARRNGENLNTALPLDGVNVARFTTDTTPGPRIYDPTHPDADAEGFVTYPNVNLVTEMTNMLSATRSYEAAMAVIEAAKRMALRALDIGR